MRRLITLVFGLLVALSLSAQTARDRYNGIKALTDSSAVDPVYKEILWNTDVLNSIQSRLIRLENVVRSRYKLYPTQNKWTFLELDTCFGLIYHVQWSIDDNSFKYTLGGVNDLTERAENYFPGRFEMYPTTNIYNFILLDTANGDVYQVQWSTEKKDEGIWKIQ